MLRLAVSISLLTIFAGVLCLRLDWLPSLYAFYLFVVGVLASTLLAFTAVALICKRLARKQALAELPGIAAVCVLPAALVLVLVGPDNFARPRIHDITTDIDNPPVFRWAQAERRPGENSLEYAGAEIAELQRQAYPDIKTVYLPVSKAQAWRAVHAVIAQLGWNILGESQEEGLLEASDASPVLGFVDDVAIRVQVLDEGVLIDLRSVSRIGLGDLGKNAARIRTFVETLKIYY